MGGVLVLWGWFPITKPLERSPDSSEYLAIAHNLRNGKGFRNAQDEIATNRSPVYPVLISAVINPDDAIFERRLQWMHRAMAFATGVLLVSLAQCLDRQYGTTCGLISAFLLGQDAELRYSANDVLTELPATFFLLFSLRSSAWARRGSLSREAAAAGAHSLLFMTRSALLFVGVGYGLTHLWDWYRFRQRESLFRGLIFGGVCSSAIAAWSVFLWSQTGQVVLLTTTGQSNMAAGMNPRYVAQATNLPVPANDTELEAFWTAAPGLTAEQAKAAFRDALSAPREQLSLLNKKLKFAFERTPIGLYYLSLFGFPLLVIAARPPGGLATSVSEQERIPESWIERVVYQVAGFIALCAFCGFSTPLFRALAMLLGPVLVVVTPVQNTLRAHDQAWRVPRDTVVMVACGFLFMTLLAFGLPRFTRPFLPVMYLSAAFCIPLMVRSYWVPFLRYRD